MSTMSRLTTKLAALRRLLLAKLTVNEQAFFTLSLIAVLIFIVAGTARHVMLVSNSVEKQYDKIAASGSYLGDYIQNKVEGDALLKQADDDDPGQPPENDAPSGSTSANKKPSNKPSSTTGPSYPSYASLPFSVLEVRMLDVARLCVSGEFEVFEHVFINDAAFVLSNENGGEVKLALDVEGLEGQSPKSYSLTIPKGETYYRASKDIPENPGPVFIVTPQTLHPAYKVRVRVTSPNSIASDWFASPAVSFEQPCTPAG